MYSSTNIHIYIYRNTHCNSNCINEKMGIYTYLNMYEKNIYKSKQIFKNIYINI